MQLLRIGSGRGASLCGRGRLRGLRRHQTRIDPAGVNTGAQTFGCLRVDIALPHDAAERRLNMTARTAETIVEIEVPESSVEIVPPEQIDHAAAEPYAFRIGCRALENPRRLRKIVSFLGGVFRGFAALLSRLGIGRLLITALG